MKKRARFWIYTVSPVRIKIEEGQTLHHTRSSRHDEGWSTECVTFSFDGEVVTAEHFTSCRDCDGRTTDGWTSVCRVEALEAGHYDETEGISYPAWTNEDVQHRDFTAESMNY